MFSGNSQTAYGKMTFVCIYPKTKTDIGRGCFFKDVFELAQCYFLSSYSWKFWTYFTPEPSKDGWRERFIRRYEHYYDIDEKHACALANFKAMSRRSFDRVEYSWKHLGDLRPAKRSRDETQCSDSVYYVRPNDGEAQVKRLRIQIKSSAVMITECRNCKELYEYRTSTYVTGYSPLACLDCEHRWREEALAAANSASAVQAVAGPASAVQAVARPASALEALAAAAARSASAEQAVARPAAGERALVRPASALEALTSAVAGPSSALQALAAVAVRSALVVQADERPTSAVPDVQADARPASVVKVVAGACAVISNCYNCPTRIWHIPRHAQDTAPRACAKCAGIGTCRPQFEL